MTMRVGPMLLAICVAVATAQTRGVVRAADQQSAIGGRVVTATSDPRPVRSAHVLLSRVDGPGGATAITDDEGRFTFGNLPAGRYVLGVQKPGFVRMNYGETRPGRPGSAIVVAANQPLMDLTLRLLPGAVITGQVVDPGGAPASDVAVHIFGSRLRSGERHLQEHSTVVTDDRGVYRVFGLPPGDYVVGARPQFRFGSGAARETTAADLERALGGATAKTAEIPGGTRRRSVGFAAVYYPGTSESATASLITLAAGQERAGIDIALRVIQLSSVEGRVAWPGRRPDDQRANVMMVPLTQSPWLHDMEFDANLTDDLTFSFPNVAPGRYAIVAQTMTMTPVAEGAAPAAAAHEILSAVYELDVHGIDMQGISLALQTGASVSGRITPPRASGFDYSSVTLELRPAVMRPIALRPPETRVNDDGTFDIRGITPGTYRLLVRSRREGGIPVGSAIVNGVNMLDDPIELKSGAQIDRAVVTFTDSPTELSGLMQDRDGRAAPEHFIVVFSTNRDRWFRDSRHIQAVRPGSDGRYLVRGLPPGQYHLAALTDVEEDEWFDPVFLDQLVPAAIKIVLSDREKKVQDIRIGR